MRLEVSLHQKQQLQLKLAPQMIQAIEILQLPNLDLLDRIELELAENEVLEVDEEGSPAVEGPSADAEAASGEDPDPTAAEAGTDAEFSAVIDRLTSMADEDREMGMRPSRSEGQEASDRKLEALQATAAPPPTLQDLLADQLSLLDGPEVVRVIARAIVYSLDDDGLLPVHDLVRPVLDAMTGVDAPPGLLEAVVDGTPLPAAAEAEEGSPGEEEAEEGTEEGEDAEEGPGPGRGAGNGSFGTWGGVGAFRGRGPRDPERAAAQREARRQDRTEARRERLREAARIAATAASLRRRLREEGTGEGGPGADREREVLLFPLVEILDLLESEGVRATLEEAEAAMAMVHSLEPRGVGGRTPEEALLLQVRPTDPLREKKRRLIRDHLEDWKKNRLPRICQGMGLSMDEVKELLAEMQGLHPHPGARLRSERSPYLHPDVIIQWAETERGEPDYEVTLVNEYFPTLRISPQYLRMFEDAGTDPAMKEMLKKKIGAARWLIDAVRQRQDTLLRVVREIVRHQHEFLDQGLPAMRPLKMQRIADDLGIHVSTVSRAISDKYAQTPQGILPLKFFFHGGTEVRGGAVESRLSVKEKVRQAIEEEDRTSPLSDEDLATRFKGEGLSIARRTVTKYRKQLGIPSSRERREWT